MRRGAAAAVAGLLALGGVGPTTHAGEAAGAELATLGGVGPTTAHAGTVAHTGPALDAGQTVRALATSAIATGPTVSALAPAPVDGLASWSLDLDARPGTTTGPRVETSPFTLSALSWDATGPQPEHLELRVRDAAGWGEWFDLAVDPATAPDGRLATEPFIADGATGAQARVVSDGVTRGLRIDFVHASSTRGSTAPLGLASAVTAGTTPARAATGDELRPKIVTRKGWGANESKTEPVSSSTWLKAMYVHHTAGTNTYTKERAPAVVRSIWAFHTKGRGWPDIGYQFLVDRFGTVYEGRRGAIDGLPVGAQAGGFNADTIGVAVMGDFTRTTPSKRVVAAVVDVLAWQAHRWGVDPRGKVRLRTATSTGSEPRWKEGRLTPALPVIRGHRDTNHTSCPGARLYARLPAIRRAVDAKVDRAVRRHGETPAQLRAPKVDPLRASAEGVSLSANVALAWHEVEGATGYEVLRRSAKHGKKAEQTRHAWMVTEQTRGTEAVVRVPRGQTWTLAVRAVDALGRPGKVRRIGTTTRPVPERRIERSDGWSTARGARYFGRTALVSREKGATLRVRKVKHATSVVLVGAKGPGLGRVAVYTGKKRVATVSFASADATPRGRIEVELPKRYSGTVRVVVRDADRPVRLSAIAFPRARLG